VCVLSVYVTKSFLPTFNTGELIKFCMQQSKKKAQVLYMESLTISFDLN